MLAISRKSRVITQRGAEVMLRRGDNPVLAGQFAMYIAIHWRKFRLSLDGDWVAKL